MLTLIARYGYDVGNPPDLDPSTPLLPLPQRRPTKALHRERTSKQPQRKTPVGDPPGAVRLAPLWAPVLRPAGKTTT